jgi:glycosyltransferase involved in cell wall biosynthesis
MSNEKTILFLTLRTFSLTGGIENVCKSIAFSLNKFVNHGLLNFNCYSLYDQLPNQEYILPTYFKGFNGKLLIGIVNSVFKGLKSDVIILSHVNLSIIGLIIKTLKPKTKVIIWTHGIEIWRALSFIQKKLLLQADQVIAVSEFTKSVMIKTHQLKAEKIKVILNCLDPLFESIDLNSINYTEPVSVVNTPYFMMLSRLKATEKLKNYDIIIKLMAELKQEGHSISYVIAGKYDLEEYKRIKNLAIHYDVKNEIIIPGFIANQEIKDYYANALAFVMPSVKEGFGLVYIEAQANGLKVICGDQDGSRETLTHALAGYAINPANENELKNILIELINKPSTLAEKIIIQHNCKEKFSYAQFELEIKNLVLETVHDY